MIGYRHVGICSRHKMVRFSDSIIVCGILEYCNDSDVILNKGSNQGSRQCDCVYRRNS